MSNDHTDTQTDPNTNTGTDTHSREQGDYTGADTLQPKTIVTYQPPELDRKRVGVVIEEHDDTAGDIRSLASDRTVHSVADSYSDVPDDEPVYRIKQCVVVTGTVKPTEGVALLPRCELTVNERLTNELRTETP